MFSGYGSTSPFTPDTRNLIAWLRSQRVQRVGEGPTLSMHLIIRQEERSYKETKKNLNQVSRKKVEGRDQALY